MRFIDAFVDQLELPKVGFVVAEVKAKGRPVFDPKVFLKLYLYGYLNGLRSSRKLEKEALFNIEVHWLLGKLAPNYHSIADFRKFNPQALRSTFKLFVLFLKHADLIKGQVVAIDGTKVRASNSKKNNCSPKKIERHMVYIEGKTNEYLSELDRNDLQDQPERLNHIQQKIAKLIANKIKYEVLGDSLSQSQEPQLSTTDADARALLIQGQAVEVSWQYAGSGRPEALVVAPTPSTATIGMHLVILPLIPKLVWGFVGLGWSVFYGIAFWLLPSFLHKP